ncbi:MAG: hypothetical protein GY723_17820 [bacterium]|nr:hypothetical protein [bacterium]MCP5068552.1 hypothetical protein [bacterium]
MTIQAIHSATEERPIPATLLELVLALQEMTGSETLTELLAADLVASGRVVLTGNFRGCNLN